MHKIVTIISDWDKGDYYLGAVKAKILSKNNSVKFVDISHNVSSFNIMQAAFILQSTYKVFPPGTIHLFAVNSIPDSNEDIVVCKYNKQFFISNDNGGLGLVFKNELPEFVYRIIKPLSRDLGTFPELDIFCELVDIIINNKALNIIGEQKKNVVRKSALLPQIYKDEITGVVAYIDSYGNAITNISKENIFDNINGRKIEIQIENSSLIIKKICNSYNDVETGNVLCLINSLGLLEIAIREGHADRLLNISTNSHIRIKFIS